MALYVNPRNTQRAWHVNRDDGDSSPRPSHQAILRLIDMTDPAWPHVAAVLREMKDAGVEINETALAIAAKMGARRFALAKAPKRRGRRPTHYQATLTGTSGSIVYYIRRGDSIKIGMTADPVQRFRDLMPDEILAFEPGDVEQEILRHRQFDHLRQHGEHFRKAPELTEHVRRVRRLHGKPDPSWPNAATAPVRRYNLPALASHETVTIAVACAQYGLKPGTIYGWVHRGLISPVGRDGRAYLFYAEHLVAIRNRTARIGRHVTPGS